MKVWNNLFLFPTSESLQGKAVAIGAMEILDSYLQHHSDDENLCQMVLLCVGSLADSGTGIFLFRNSL